MDTAWHDPEGNITRADELVAAATERSADDVNALKEGVYHIRVKVGS